MPQHHKSSTQIKLDRALSERTLLQTRVMKFRTTADLLHDEMQQTRKDQRAAPWERFGSFEMKLQELETKLTVWEDKIVDVEDRLVRLDEYCEELFALEGSEKERFDCAIGTSILLTLLFAYDGIILGLPQADFWTYLVIPHTLVALCVIGVVWKRGLMHEMPATYIFGFVGILALAMVHQHSFLQQQRDWRDMAVVVSHAIEARGGGLVTIEDGSQLLAKQRWDAVGNVINDYWKSFLNYTHYRTP